MRYFLLLLATLLCVFQHLKGQSSLIDLKGNNNVVRVIQGNGTVVYNLDNKEQYHSFLSYLKSLPKIGNEISNILDITTQTNQLLKTLAKKSKLSGVFDPSIFLNEFGKVKIENHELKIQLENLKSQISDTVLKKVLIRAAKLLETYDNEGYQKTLEEVKKKIKTDFENNKKNIAEINFLQAKNNLSNGLLDKASEQVLMAIEYDSTNTSYFVFLGSIYLVKGEPHKALRCYQKTDLFEQGSNSKLNYEISGLNVNIGYAYLFSGNAKQAMVYFKRALLVNLALDSCENSYLAMNYYAIGFAYEVAHNHDSAIAYHKITLNMYKKIFGDTSRFVKALYINIAYNYIHKHDDERAFFYFRQACSDVTLAKDQANLYKEYGEREFNKGQFLSSIRYYKIALYIIDISDVRDFDKLRLLLFQNLALVYCQNNDELNADLFFKKAISLMENNKMTESEGLNMYKDCVRAKHGN